MAKNDITEETKLRVALARLRGERATVIGAREGIAHSQVYRYVNEYGPALALEHGLTFPPPTPLKPPRKTEQKEMIQKFTDAIKDEAVVARLKDESVMSIARRLECSPQVVSNWLKERGERLAKAHDLPWPPTRHKGGRRQEPERQLAFEPARADQQKRKSPDKPFPRDVKLAAVQAVIDGQRAIGVAHSLGVSKSLIYQWYTRYAPRLFAEKGLPFVSLQAKGNDDPPTTATLLSRPSPPSGYAQNNHAPSSVPGHAPSHALALREGPGGGDADTARQALIDEMKESALRQALRERDALAVVMEMMTRNGGKLTAG